MQKLFLTFFNLNFMSEIKATINAKETVTKSNVTEIAKSNTLDRYKNATKKVAPTKGSDKGNNNMYNTPYFVANSDFSDKAIKAFRDKMRKDILPTLMTQLFNALIDYANNQKDSKAQLIAFVSAYKCFYKCNDFSISSIVGASSTLSASKRKEYAEDLEQCKKALIELKISISEISANQNENYATYGFLSSNSRKYNFEK
jgi:hypothetical protein